MFANDGALYPIGSINSFRKINAQKKVRKKRMLQTNLIIGTGNACAWHKSPKLCPTERINETLYASDGNAGAFDPTGSNFILF